MRNKFLQKLLMAFQLMLAVTLFAECMRNVFGGYDRETVYSFGECALRLVFISMFTVYYYTNFMENSRPDSIFMPFYLFFSTTAELKILENVTYAPPVLMSYIHTFSTLAMLSMAICYGLCYHETSFSTRNLYLGFFLATSFVISMLIPKTQNLDEIWRSSTLFVVTAVLLAVVLLVHIRLLIIDPPGSTWVRHFSIMLLSFSSCLNICFDAMLINAIGTIVYGVSTILVILLTSRTAIQF